MTAARKELSVEYEGARELQGWEAPRGLYAWGGGRSADPLPGEPPWS